MTSLYVRSEMAVSSNESLRTLTVITDTGLSNRLRVLLSGIVLADATQRHFRMLWTPDRNCGCTFDQLFSNHWNVENAYWDDDKSVWDLRRGTWQSFPDLTLVQKPALVLNYYSWLIKPRLYPQHAALETRCMALMNELEPLPALMQKIRAFQRAHFGRKMIGVHLRRGDFHHARPDVVANEAVAMQAVDEWLERAPDAGIFLCTDDGAYRPRDAEPYTPEGVREHFVQRYGTRVVYTTPRSLDRGSPEAIEDALIDLWLLRATDYVVGTTDSSFSELAVFGRAVPFVFVGAPTLRYQRIYRWVARCGLAPLTSALAQREFGYNAPVTLLGWRYLARLRSRFGGKWMRPTNRRPSDQSAASHPSEAAPQND
jgi:hypothetical protein